MLCCPILFSLWNLEDHRKDEEIEKAWLLCCAYLLETYFVPLYELITDFYAAIIHDYLHIYSKCSAVWSYPARPGSLCEVGLLSVRRWRWMIKLSLLNGQRPHLPPAFRRCRCQPMTPHRRGHVGPAAHRCTWSSSTENWCNPGVSCSNDQPRRWRWSRSLSV